MIDDVLVFLKNRLNNYLNSGRSPEDSAQDKVVFVDGEKTDPLSFQLGAVSILLINVEEENTLRPPDLYARTLADGQRQRVRPEIRLNLYVLLVARFKQYEEGLSFLSRVIQHFQHHRLIDHHSAPDLSEDIDHLNLELVTLPFSEQNEVWSALRTAYLPSVLYRVRMAAFREQEAIEPQQIEERVVQTSA
jgi:hypothetical protein